MRNYFLLYDEAASVNYKHLLKLYGIGEYNKKNRLYDTITYNTLDELTQRINDNYGKCISKSTLSDFLNDKGTQKHNYKYFSYDKDSKTIKLYNDFKNTDNRTSRKFVVLSEKEFDFLVSQADNMLISYFLYIKYYCGASASKSTDFTAEQFLAACGLCSTSGSNKQKISKYNSILSSAGLISIERKRDNNGHLRNTYRIPLL